MVYRNWGRVTIRSEPARCWVKPLRGMPNFAGCTARPYLHKIDHNARFHLGCISPSAVPRLGWKLHRVPRRGLVDSPAPGSLAHIDLR